MVKMPIVSSFFLQTSNDDENATSLSYDPTTMTLVSVTEGYVNHKRY